MSLIQVIKTELYKSNHRKSSLMLLIPMLLAFVISLGYSQGMVKLDLMAPGNDAYSCMDFVLIVWMVLSGLGIMGILLILFSAFQFSGEIERGQIKLMLLRIGKRSNVILGKYLAALIVVCITVAGTLLVCVGSYYLFVSGSTVGTGTFNATIAGLSTLDVFISIGLQALMYLVLIGLTFLIGIYANPFVTFIITMVFLYVGNYFISSENLIAKLLPSYWSNQLILNGTAPFSQITMSVFAVILLSAIILMVSMTVFQKKDVK